MRFLFLDKFTLKTKQSKSDILQNVSEQVIIEKIFRFYYQNSFKPYKGIIKSKGFKIEPIIYSGYRNSIVIIGKIKEKDNYTEIHIVMRLHMIILLIYLLFKCIFITLIMLFIILSFNNIESLWLAFIMLGFVILLDIIFIKLNKTEIKRLKKALISLLVVD